MEVFLKSFDLSDRTQSFKEIGVSSVEEIALHEPDRLCTILSIEKDKAGKLVEKAKEMVEFQKRKVLVQTTWKSIQESAGVDATKLLYQHFFQEFPSVKALFERKHIDTNQQAKKLYDTLSLAIKYLDDIDELIPFLEKKGQEHAEEFHCERKHYKKIGECLFWTLKRSLGNTAWTPDVEDAWIWVYDVFSKTMAEAGEIYLLKRRKAAVLRTWEAVEDALEMKNNLATQATQLFYERLFEKHPSIVPMFENSDIHGQAIKLFKTIHMAVHVLDSPDDLKPKLQEMGRRHRDYKITREHYDAVGECLIWTLKMGLGDTWTEEVADAWTWVYHMMAETMADAAEEIEKNE